MAQRLGWAILLTIRHAVCLIMLDRSTSTHQHRSGLGLHQLAISVSSIHGRRSLSLGVRFHQRRRFCVGPWAYTRALVEAFTRFRRELAAFVVAGADLRNVMPATY